RMTEGAPALRASPRQRVESGDEDAAGDEAIPDGGRTRLVLYEALQEIDHFCLHGSPLLRLRRPLSPGRSKTGTNASRTHLAARLISVAEITVIGPKYSVVNDTFFQLFVG